VCRYLRRKISVAQTFNQPKAKGASKIIEIKLNQLNEFNSLVLDQLCRGMWTRRYLSKVMTMRSVSNGNVVK
jgi:hypothetical protein